MISNYKYIYYAYRQLIRIYFNFYVLLSYAFKCSKNQLSKLSPNPLNVTNPKEYLSINIFSLTWSKVHYEERVTKS